MKYITNVYAVCAFAALGGMLFGLDIASMSGVIGTVAYNEFFGFPRSIVQGYITAAMPAGSIAGTAFASFIGDRFSRKVAIQASCLFWIVGSVVQALSNGIPVLVVGRVIGGIGIGSVSTIVPIYQAEMAPKEIRGKMIALQQFAITLGILIGFFVQYGASFIDGGAESAGQDPLAFRLPWALQTIPAIVLFAGLFALPYSPRWLASKDRWEEAIQVLADLHAHGDVKHPKVLAQYREIEESLRFEIETTAAGWKALAEPQMMKRVLLGMAVQTWSALSGINVLMYYVVYLMQAANIGTPLLISSIQYILNVVMTLPALFYVDTWGRRPLMLIGTVGMSVFLFLSGTLQAIYGEPNPDPLAEVAWIIHDNIAVSRGIVACSYLFVALFAMTMGPLSWIFPSEIFPTKVRTRAVSLSTATNWSVNTILAFAVPPMLNHISWRTYMVFGACNLLAFIHLFFAMPETKNKTLEEMDVLFDRKSWIRPWVSENGKMPKGGRLPLDELERQIAMGEVKVLPPGCDGDSDTKPIMVETVIEMTNQRRPSYGSEAGSESSLDGTEVRKPIAVASRASSTGRRKAVGPRGTNGYPPKEWYHAS